jgi:lysine-specific demethylase 8
MWYPRDLVNISGQIERIRKPSKEAFRRYVASRTPVIVEGALNGDGAPDSRTAVSTWTCDYLKHRIGDNEVEVHVAKDGLYDEDHHKLVKMKLSDCLDRLSTPAQTKPLFWPKERYYLYRAPLGLFGPVLGDVATPEFIPFSRSGDESNLWMSQAGNITPPHMDFVENLLTQVRGSKSVLLWDSSQWSNLYINHFGQEHARQSPIDITKPDVSRFPLFSRARAIEGVMEPGDALFIPFGCIHCVRSDTFSLAVEYSWGNRPLDRIRTILTSPLLSYWAHAPWVSFKLLARGTLRRLVGNRTKPVHDTKVPSVMDTAVPLSERTHW